MMAKAKVNEFNSQIIAENVSFLDNCFDNTFVLQNSLACIKEYIAESQHESCYKMKSIRKRSISQANNVDLDANVTHSRVLTQCKINNKLLKNWGLPGEIARKYEEKGITEMFDWQVSCLENSKVLIDNCNLVYSAPTSAGKTLVAEILTIKTVLERQKKVIVILPFVSIVREKMFYLQHILSSSGIRVEGFMGSQAPPGGLQAVHVAICTIEKANSLINRLLDENNISELGALIVDEMHLLGDSHRGYILELLLTKIKYVSIKRNIQIQIIGMSATLPNLEELAKWLNAELFITDYRPIPLNEFCLVGTKYYDKHRKYVDNITSEFNIENDSVLSICLETIKEGCSILIFCMTKNRCENLAQNIANSFYKLGCSSSDSGIILRNQLKSDSILEVLEQLKNCPVGLDQILKCVVSFGVAYHHAGLTFDERDIIEGGFKSGALRVLVATSTLSSGVNLPARKVIIRSPVFQKQPINILAYKQMIGRAGRMGKDTKGESILICTEAEKKIGFQLMIGSLDPVKSCIDNEDKYMRAILEMIASEDVCTRDELELYSQCTLLFAQKLLKDNFLLESTLKELVNFELIRNQTDDDECYVATSLGKACLSSSMAPNDGLSLFCEIQKARQCLVLETDLHLIYLVTPYSVSSQWSDIDWLHLLTLWESLTKAMKRVGELVGVQESFIICSLRGTNNSKICPKKLNIHKRFYTALALQDLVNEVPLSQVATKFQCARGFLQGLQQAAATFAGMVTAFCRQLGWKNMEMLISQFQDRLHFGIHSELIELMKLPSLNSTRARALFDAGLETISSIASTDPNLIENIFHKAVPFQSEKGRDDDDAVDIKKRKIIKNIWITGCCGMTPKEAANILILEARKYLEQEIGVTEIKWHKDVKYTTKLDENPENSDSNELKAKKAVNVIASNENNKGEVHVSLKENENSSLDNCDKSSENVSKFDIQNKGQQINKFPSLRENVECEQNVAAEKICNNNESTKEKDSENGVLVNIKLNGLKVKKNSYGSHITNNNGKLKETKNNIEFIESHTNSPCSSIKDEILWESLTFTETGIENISKARISDTLFSPNISFGEVRSQNDNNVSDMSKSIGSSDKDVSLFSSDSDNSFLDEYLSMNSGTDNAIVKTHSDQIKPRNNDITDYINVNSNTILNAFRSPVLQYEECEDIKLIYDDDNEICKDSDESPYRLDNNEVMNTQQEEKMSLKNSFISPLKRPAEASSRAICQSTVKKKKITKSSRSQSNEIITLKCRTSKCTVIKIAHHKLILYDLKGEDISRNLELIEKVELASIIVETGSLIPIKNELIGCSILKKCGIPIKSSKHRIKNMLIKSLTLCVDDNLVIYLDLMSLDNLSPQSKSVLTKWFQNRSLVLRMLSFKSCYATLKEYFQIEILANCSDLILREWLIDSDTRMHDVFELAAKYCQLDLINTDIEIDGRLRKYTDLGPVEDKCLKAWCALEVAERQQLRLLEQYNFVRNTIEELADIETHVLKILANSERRGIAVDKNLASQLLIDVKQSQDTLQMKAFKICGYHFNFNSSKSVAKVLGLYKGRKISTSKSVLTAHSSTLASIVIFWRKLNSILTKTLYPLTEKACVYTEGNRITPSYTMFTCTGRISMHEPNLQNVPRTFSVPANYLSLEEHSESSHDVMEFNCRNIFRAAPGHVFVSADYCQLEMRILTHYSGDPVLTKIMTSNVDVFKSIASSWSGVPEEEVDDDLRQKAKQLCYGILYGMGHKTLAQHLDVTESEASVFMSSFYNKYPALKVFIQTIIEECKKTGYVETLRHRRRYLPDINASVGTRQSAAERQAVNTKIQGSAADIAKTAMCAIDRRTDCVTHKPHLVLQMHDELIYEVPEAYKHCFIGVIKEVMEGSVYLNVPLPVKVKSGYTWGTLEEVKS